MLRGHEGRTWKGTYDLHFNHHESLEDLEHSASSVCGICRVLFEEWTKEERKPATGTSRQSSPDPQIDDMQESLDSTKIDTESKGHKEPFSSTASLSVVRGLDEHDLFRLDFCLKASDRTRKKTFVLRQIGRSNFHSSKDLGV